MSSVVVMVNLLPCTEDVSQEDEARATEIIKDATPPGFTFVGVRPEVRLGRNPHRWIGIFLADSDSYETGCQSMRYLKQQFRRFVPQWSDISAVKITTSTSIKTIEVEYLVNCYCSKVSRRRRSLYPRCQLQGYTTESGVCRKWIISNFWLMFKFRIFYLTFFLYLPFWFLKLLLDLRRLSRDIYLVYTLSMWV